MKKSSPILLNLEGLWYEKRRARSCGANISGYSALFCNFFSKNDREIQLVVLHTINPVKSTKWVTTFSCIFHFSLKDFSKKIFEIFFYKCQMSLGYVELCGRSKKKKIYFGGIHSYLCRLLGLE